MKLKYLIVGALILLAALLLAACSGSGAPTATDAPAPAPTQVVCPTAAPAPACPAPPEPVVQDVPYQEAWANSGHNNATAEAFTHWDSADPQEVPATCAKCHSTPGYQDWLGIDGTAAGTVDNPAPTGTTIQCVACHNAGTAALNSVTFPSGLEVTGVGPAARCMACHQGRESKVSVDQDITDAGLAEDLDKVSPDLGFVNVHYFAAAATLYGTEAKGGYEYDGKMYDSKFDHVAGYDTCNGCHDQHSLELKVDECSNCHTNVSSKDDLKNIRMAGSGEDYNGNGDTTEGIYYEIQGLLDMEMQAMQAYAKEVAGTALVYDPNSYPYFFVDTNENGQVDDGEAVSDNAYKAFTARLLRAAYNYQFSIKDPGSFAHGGKYIIELLYDSIEDLNTKLSTPVDLSNAHREDAGHFAGSHEQFRHWDEEGEVPGSCARCHTASGLPTYLKEGVNISAEPSNGLNCATCHNDLTTFTRYEVGAVTFPSGANLDLGQSDANLCINCHQARESTVSVNRAITASGAGDDEVSDKLRFINSHYFGAGATLFGTEAKGAYEYAGQEYNGRNTHVEAFDTCVECHDVHTLSVKADKCGTCHAGVKTEADLATISNMGGDSNDYNGDGKTAYEEGLKAEVDGMTEKLYAALQTYAQDTAGTAIVYDGASYPYFFADANGNGQLDEGEATYASWTPRLLRAAYNLQWVNKDPGAYAHNGMYMMQVLYDSIADLGGDVTGMVRPAVKPAQ